MIIYIQNTLQVISNSDPKRLDRIVSLGQQRQTESGIVYIKLN